jgi:GNAT superfamily N-acetyltransferase
VETQAVDSFVSTHHAEELTGWLTLEMSKDAMKSFLVTRGATLELADEPDRSAQERSDSRCTESPQNQPSDIIINTISRMNNFLANKANDNKQAMTLRLAREEDAASIFELVNGLAVYEKAADEVTINSETYQRDGCGAEHPIFHCILVELHDEDSKSALVVGMGLFYFGYSSSNEGKYLYLEDIFIQEAYRGRGCGKSIMLTLADIAFQSDCNRFVWQALDWNTPALEFYEAIGAKVCTGLVTVRLNEEQI